MKKIVPLLAAGWFFVSAQPETFPSSREPAVDVIMPLEKGKVVYTDKKTGTQRSSLEYAIRCTERGGSLVYLFEQKGSGDYNKYRGVRWEVSGEAFVKDGLVLPLYNRRTITDKGGKVIIEYTKRYNYKKNIVDFFIRKGPLKATIHRRFRIKGYTVDDTTLTGFLRTFLKIKDKQKVPYFYLLSNKPALYKVKAKVLGEEWLEVAGKKVKALKIKLTPLMGIFTPLAKIISSPAYIWYTSHPPYVWVKYEGLESGLHSPQVITYLCQSSRNRSNLALINKKWLHFDKFTR